MTPYMTPYDIIYGTLCHTQVLLLGSGGLSIGQAGEFDYSGSQVVIVHSSLWHAVCRLWHVCGVCGMCVACVWRV